MPERLDRVTVLTPNGEVFLSWEERQALLAQLERTPGAADIHATFDAVGASRPVELDAGQRNTLKNLLAEWLMDDEVFDDERGGILDVHTALNRGEPWESTLEDWEAGDEGGRGFDSANWRWRRERWGERPRPSDHLHCLFCNTRFADGTQHPTDLQEGWCSLDESDYERWVCAGCFEKLHERFVWKVERSPAS